MEDTIEVMVNPAGAEALRELAATDETLESGIAYSVSPEGWAYARIARRHLPDAEEIGAVEIY